MARGRSRVLAQAYAGVGQGEQGHDGERHPRVQPVLLAAAAFRMAVLHGDVHSGNVVVRVQEGAERVVLLDWARARLGSPLEDVSSWLQSLGYWEFEARRRHDTLLRRYLAARGLSTHLGREVRDVYWFAGACNVLAGALRYQLLAADGWSSVPSRARADAAHSTALTFRRWRSRPVRAQTRRGPRVTTCVLSGAPMPCGDGDGHDCGRPGAWPAWPPIQGAGEAGVAEHVEVVARVEAHDGTTHTPPAELGDVRVGRAEGPPSGRARAGQRAHDLGDDAGVRDHQLAFFPARSDGQHRVCSRATSVHEGLRHLWL